MARFSMFTGKRLSLKTFNEKPLFGFSKATLMIDLGGMIFIVNCLLMIHMEYYALFFLNEISSKHYFPAAIFFHLLQYLIAKRT